MQVQGTEEAAADVERQQQDPGCLRKAHCSEVIGAGVQNDHLSACHTEVCSIATRKRLLKVVKRLVWLVHLQSHVLTTPLRLFAVVRFCSRLPSSSQAMLLAA